MSSFGKLNWADVGKGVLIAFGTAFLLGLNTSLQAGTLPTWTEIITFATAGLAAAIAYVVKNVLTNSNNKLLEKETK